MCRTNYMYVRAQVMVTPPLIVEYDVYNNRQSLNLVSYNENRNIRAENDT